MYTVCLIDICMYVNIDIPLSDIYLPYLSTKVSNYLFQSIYVIVYLPSHVSPFPCN